MPRDSALSTPVGDVSWRVVPATMLARCAGREFSVPRRCIGRRVRLPLEPGGRLRVYDGGELVATHDTAAPGGPIVYREGDYAEAMADKRWDGDADIEAQARRNLELLGGLGGGEESRPARRAACRSAYAATWRSSASTRWPPPPRSARGWSRRARSRSPRPCPG